MSAQRILIGFTGAPCTGKTTLATWLSAALALRGVECELLPELARQLKAQGVRIDQEMGPADYDAFLEGYAARDGRPGAPLAIADRTPVDHYSYIAANGNVPPRFKLAHRTRVLELARRYALLFYLPVEWPPLADGFRVTDQAYRAELDRHIADLLGLVGVPVVVLRGGRQARRQACWAALAARGLVRLEADGGGAAAGDEAGPSSP